MHSGSGPKLDRQLPVLTADWLCRDILGDAACVNEIKAHRDKPWVNDLMIPYGRTLMYPLESDWLGESSIPAR